VEALKIRERIFREGVKVFLAGFLIGLLLGVIDFWRVSFALHAFKYLKPYLIDTQLIFLTTTVKLALFFGLVSLVFFFIHRMIVRFFGRRRNRGIFTSFSIAELYVWLIFLYVIFVLRFSIGPPILDLSKTSLLYLSLLLPALILALCTVPRMTLRCGAKTVFLFYAVMAAAVVFPFVWLQLYITGTVGSEDLPEPSGKRKNVVLIILDTARKDALSCYGNKKKVTPAIDRIAREGMLFRNCYSPSNWTIPVHASIFTGLYPSSHRVNMIDWRMPSNITTLAEVLRRHGYQTAGFTANTILSGSNRFDLGFTYYKCYSDHQFLANVRYFLMGNVVWAKLGLADLQKPRDFPPDAYFQKAGDLVRDVRNWFEYDRREDRPFFLFMNFMDVHYPYQPPEPYLSQFSSLRDEKNFYTHFLEPKDYFSVKYKLNDDDIIHLRELYDGSMAYLDASLEQLFQFFRDRALFDNIFLVIASDHGEYFGEHEEYYYKLFHSFGIFDQLVSVPLILRHPDLIPAHTEVDGLVSLVDILPTIFDAAGIDLSVMPHPVQGESLLSLAEKGGRDYSYYEFQVMPLKKFLKRKQIPRILKVYPDIRLKLWFRSFTAIQDREFKLVKDSTGGIHLYHLPSDPLESRPVNDAFPEIYNRMYAALEERHSRFLGEAVKKGSEHMSQETLDQLRRLGYLQ